MDSLRSGLIEEYVLDLCSPEERRQVEEAAEKDPELAALLEEVKLALQHYCEAQTHKPPAHLKEKIAASIEHERTNPPSAKQKTQAVRRHRSWLAAACISLLLASALLVRHSRNLETNLTRLNAEYDKAITDRQLLTSELEALREKFEFLSHEATQQVRLEGTAHAPQAAAIVYWNPLSKDAVIRFQMLPPAPSGKVYQMWADVEGKMLSMGPIEELGTWIKLPFVEHAESLNLTLEAASGSTEPDVEQIYIRGEI